MLLALVFSMKRKPDGGTQPSSPSLRKYLGAIKDTTMVNLAKVNSGYKELDIAIVKATNHAEKPAEEKYIKTIFDGISATRPRADVAYCIHALAKRLGKTHNWAVALKTLVVIHRALREVDPSFKEELINYGRCTSNMLNLAHFKDDSSADAWDYSAWIRNYALFIEERLECYRVLNYDIETNPLRIRDLETSGLLEQLPALQQLLFRLLGCQPQGSASFNVIVHHALTMVALESVKLYNAINDGTTNMVDKFFEMPINDATRALEIYKRANQQGERLSEFYEVCKTIHVGRGENFLTIEQPPASFLATMEEYVRDAPRALTARKDQVTDKKITAPKIPLPIEYKKVPEVQEAAAAPPPPPPPPEPVEEEAPNTELADLLSQGMSDPGPDTSELDNKNALALAIVSSDDASTSGAAPPAGASFENEEVTGWELALVTAPSSNDSAVASSKLAGRLNKFTLDSLYDEAHRRANQSASYNQWETVPLAGPTMQPVVQDPFYVSNAIATPHTVQMAALAQQQQAFVLQQQMMLSGQAPQNPYANPFVAVTPVHPYNNTVMPFHASNTYTGLI